MAHVLATRLAMLRPRVGIVLGSGMDVLADALDAPVHVPFEDLPDLPALTVAGHSGEVVAGTLDGVNVVLQRGRPHLYEGHAPDVAVSLVRMLAGVGIDTLMLTNAAGGLDPQLPPPRLMLVADHVNLTFRSALAGPVRAGEERFPDMSAPYDVGLRAAARAAALDLGIPLTEGVYAGLLGPSYETPAEIRMLRRLGADAVGMSTVNEVIVARALGMRVLAISAITNLAAGLAAAPLSHDEVLAAGRTVSNDLARLLRVLVGTRHCWTST